MVGYHITTIEHWNKIKLNGLKPSLNSCIDFPSRTAPYTKDGAIWVFKRKLIGSKLVGFVFCIAILHNSCRIVQLRINYNKKDSVCTKFFKNTGDIIKLTHAFNCNVANSIGQFSHINNKMDLIIGTVLIDNIQLINSWNLLKLIK